MRISALSSVVCASVFCTHGRFCGLSGQGVEVAYRTSAQDLQRGDRLVTFFFLDVRGLVGTELDRVLTGLERLGRSYLVTTGRGGGGDEFHGPVVDGRVVQRPHALCSGFLSGAVPHRERRERPRIPFNPGFWFDPLIS